MGLRGRLLYCRQVPLKGDPKEDLGLPEESTLELDIVAEERDGRDSLPMLLPLLRDQGKTMVGWIERWMN